MNNNIIIINKERESNKYRNRNLKYYKKINKNNNGGWPLC